MSVSPEASRKLYVAIPVDDTNDLVIMAIGMEVGAICERIGIDAEEIHLDQEYPVEMFYKSQPGRGIDSIITVTFCTAEDAAAFRIASPAGAYYASYDEI